MNFTFITQDCSDKRQTASYTDSILKYGEILHNGTFRTVGFGRTEPDYNFDTTFKKFPDREELAGFVVEFDGISLINHWEYVNHEETAEDGCLTIRMLLRHTEVECEVFVCTRMDDSGCFSRWLEIKNCSKKTVSLTRLAIMSGKLEYLENWADKLQEKHDTPYRLGYFENSEWKYEGQFRWHELHSDKYSFGGRYTRFRYRHPFCVLENRATGDIYAMQLAYSGGYLFSFDFRNSPYGEGILAFTAEIDGLKPIRNLYPSETIRTPELIITHSNKDFDSAIQQMHTHIRNVYVPEKFRGEMFLEAQLRVGGVCKDWGKKAADAGIEINYRDASWFSKEPWNFIDFAGDWEANAELFPNGYRELSEFCEANGMRCGLWMEPERVGARSKRMETDKDKFLYDEAGRRYIGELDGITFSLGESGFYNLSKKEVCDYVEKMICQVIDESGIYHFRLDCNIEYFIPWVMNWDKDNIEAADFRYHENLYAMWNRLRERYPDVVFENCASGGGRTDLGMMKYFDHTWISDNFDMPRSFTTLNGMTMCLPPEILTALVIKADKQSEKNHMLALFTRASICRHEDFDDAKKFISAYKNFSRPLIRNCKMYHHTPSFDSHGPIGYGILEAASPDAKRDMIGLFKLYGCGNETVTLKCKGVNTSYNYKITSYRTGEHFILSGYELKHRGIEISLERADADVLFMIEKI